MRSLIILEVEHGDSTDDIQEFVEVVSNPNHDDGDQWLECFGFDFRVTNTTVRVDVPPCFVLDSEPDTDDGLTCGECGGTDGKHFLNCSVWGFNH